MVIEVPVMVGVNEVPVASNSAVSPVPLGIGVLFQFTGSVQSFPGPDHTAEFPNAAAARPSSAATEVASTRGAFFRLRAMGIEDFRIEGRV